MSEFQNLLIEIGTEELPPKALSRFNQTFTNEMKEQLSQLDIQFNSIKGFATPRRIGVLVEKVASKQPDSTNLRLGPAVSAAIKDGKPTPAALGFAKSCGVSFEELEHIPSDKGPRLGIEIKTTGKPTTEFIENIVSKALTKLPIPKMMRWGEGETQFSRPVHWITCLWGSEPVAIRILNLESSALTYGHRFHHPESIPLNNAADYENTLFEAKVIADFYKRKQVILEQVQKLEEELKATIVVSPELLDEVTALVEWPVALVGTFDEAFLEVPKECLISSMAEHQKYFHVTDDQGHLKPLFVTIANIESHRPQSIIEGNEKVVRPRLADAKFFFDSDKKIRLEERLDRLKPIVFQKQLGTLYDKTIRVKHIASELCEQLSSQHDQLDSTLVERAALLSKCDLVSDMVGEFPELQGIMGQYYAMSEGEDKAVSTALNEIYMPRFSGDSTPKTITGAIIALADRLDTITGIFGIGQAPTGAKDPFALRRATLGVIRICLDHNIDIALSELLERSLNQYKSHDLATDTNQQVKTFFFSRLKSYFQDQGKDARVINAVLNVDPASLLDASRRIEAVQHFIGLDTASSLGNSTKRVNNILRKEADSIETGATINEALFSEPAENQLFNAITETTGKIRESYSQKDYAKTLNTLVELEPVITQFFDNVMVMAEDQGVKANRLALLKALQPILVNVADISELDTQ